MASSTFIPGIPLNRASTYSKPPSDFKPSSAGAIEDAFRKADRAASAVEADPSLLLKVKDITLKEPITRYTDSACAGWGFGSPAKIFDAAASSWASSTSSSHSDGSNEDERPSYTASATAVVWLSVCGMTCALLAAAAWLFLVTCVPGGRVSFKAHGASLLVAAAAATAFALGGLGALTVIAVVAFGLFVGALLYFRRKQYAFLDAHFDLAALSVLSKGSRSRTLWAVCAALCGVMLVCTVMWLESLGAVRGTAWLGAERQLQAELWSAAVLLTILGALKHVAHMATSATIIAWWRSVVDADTSGPAALLRALTLNLGTAVAGAVLIPVGSLLSWNSKAWALYLSTPGCASCRNFKQKHCSGGRSAAEGGGRHEEQGACTRIGALATKAHDWQANAQVAYASPAFVFTAASGEDFDASGRQVLRLLRHKHAREAAGRYATSLGLLTTCSMWGIALLGSALAMLVASMAQAPHEALHAQYRGIAASAGLLWGLAFGAIVTSVLQAAGEGALLLWLLWPNQLQAQHGAAFYDLLGAYAEHEGELLRRLRYKQLQGEEE